MLKTKCRRCSKKCGSGFCSADCRTKFNEARRLSRAARKAAGLCSQCGKKAVRKRTLCPEHARRWAAANKRVWDKIKAAVFEGYGGAACSCCGTTVPAFLTIDHINGGGGKHRRENRLIGSQLYRWLLRKKCPAGFRVMCFNCNSGRQNNGGVCPCDGTHHQIARYGLPSRT